MKRTATLGHVNRVSDSKLWSHFEALNKADQKTLCIHFLFFLHLQFTNLMEKKQLERYF